MSNNFKDTKHIKHIARRIHFVRNDEEFNIHKPVNSERRLELADIGNKNVRYDEMNPILGYFMVIFNN